MREIFRKYAEEFASGKSSAEYVSNLSKIMNENALYHEEGACLEKLYNITKETELYEKIGDVFLYKAGIPEIANSAYNKFIKLSMPSFYDKWAKNINSLGVNCVSCEDDIPIPSKIETLYDNYDLLVYMIICLYKHDDYEGIIELSEYLKCIRTKLDENDIKDKYKPNEENFCNSNFHLSDILSKTKHHNDINSFAIYLNPDNRQAYINILEDYIEYNKTDDAVRFYVQYATKFNLPLKDSIVDICWEISDYYRDIFNFYDAVRLQKFALELDKDAINEV